MRCLVGREGLELPFGDHRPRRFLARPALGPFYRGVGQRHMAPGKQPDRRRIEKAATAADAGARKAGLRAGADGGNRTHTSGLETVARPSSCIRRMNATIPTNADDHFVRWLSKSFKL